MHDDYNIDELKKKLNKRRQKSSSKKDELPRLMTEKEVVEIIKKENASKKDEAVKETESKDVPSSTLDESFIEDYRDEEKETLKLEYEEENSEEEKEEKSFNLPKFSLPNINYWKLAATLILFIVLITIVTYLFSSWSNIETVEIKGNYNLTDEEILERSGVSEGGKMYLLQSNKAEEKLDALPIVKSIDINRQWPHKVVIEIEEYKIVGFVESSRNYYPVLENKRILRGFNMTPESAPILHFFEGREFEGVVDSLTEINPEILRKISEIYYRPYDESFSRIQVLMNDGQEIIADYYTFGEKINYYVGMHESIDDKAGVIDLEVSNTFIPYNTSEARRVKQDMTRIPEHAPYLEDINKNLDSVKKALEKIEEPTN